MDIRRIDPGPYLSSAVVAGDFVFLAGHMPKGHDGQIVGAYSGSSKGTEALKSFLDVIEGTFEFKRSPTRYPPTIHAPNNMSLMLGLLRVKDEETTAP